MKQYDKIWVPDGLGDKVVVNHASKIPIECRASAFQNVIVLTIEEAKEMWEECRDETWQDARPTAKYEKPDRLPGFEGYLKSKGISI